MKQKALWFVAFPLLLASCGTPAPATATEWTIGFNSKGGSAVASLKVKHGEKASKPADPTYEGYSFLGWYVDDIAVTPFDWTIAITADWTLYAGWKITPGPSSSSEPATSSTPGTSAPAGDLTYTCTDLPTWIQNDGCVIFAWGWGGSDFGNGKWASLEISGTNASFKAAAELDGFLLARCAAGTTTPSWQEKSNVPGRVYNQTENITVVKGTYTYRCAEWKDYNP